MRLLWTRNRWWGLVKAVTGWGLGMLEVRVVEPAGSGQLQHLPVGLADTALFHRAGEPQPVEIPLVTVEEIRLG